MNLTVVQFRSEGYGKPISLKVEKPTTARCPSCFETPTGVTVVLVPRETDGVSMDVLLSKETLQQLLASAADGLRRTSGTEKIRQHNGFRIDTPRDSGSEPTAIVLSTTRAPAQNSLALDFHHANLVDDRSAAQLSDLSREGMACLVFATSVPEFALDQR
uniref:Uncharacterized protein n=1 Tax=Mycena chlorophos TaxID=658473 RepID=A0ABQ0KY61_MYCCL|nr:predicted protein [Mycena chlorophos]